MMGRVGGSDPFEPWIQVPLSKSRGHTA